MADKLDPFDIAALERSVNDSAGRVSTIWASYLVFGLYLAIAAGNVTHRQLFLEEPIKLPVLNIELPLWWFFLLAPVLFVVFHVYVLLQVLLLGRTAAAYNEALNRAVWTPPGNAAMRQRLANTLFAQIFAGSPREREGPIGRLLKGMAWTTLAIAPALVLMEFQFAFLPYHSHLVTWAHRLLILFELAIVFMFWPMALDARRDFAWRPLRRPAALATLGSFLAVAVFAATFPGEPHVALLTGGPIAAVDCGGIADWRRMIVRADLPFDRLALRDEDVVDDGKLAEIEKATAAQGMKPHEGERTRIFRNRNLDCGTFISADLRRAAFDNASLSGADLSRARLQGASLDTARLRKTILRHARLADAWLRRAELQDARLGFSSLQRASLDEAQLQDAQLYRADLQGASLERADLRGAELEAANLRGAFLIYTDLQNATLDDAQLQDAGLSNAKLQGSSLRDAKLQGAVLHNTELRGADLKGAQLQGASLDRARMQGARLSKTNFQGASLGDAELQGASFERAELQGAWLAGAKLQGALVQSANLDGAFLKDTQLQGSTWDGSSLREAFIANAVVWRAQNADCRQAWTAALNLKAVIEVKSPSDQFPDKSTPAIIRDFIAASVDGLPPATKAPTQERLRDRLLTPIKAEDEAAERTWVGCAEETTKASQPAYEERHAVLLRDLACGKTEDRKAIGQGIARNWLFYHEVGSPAFAARLAQGLLGLDGKDCPVAKEWDEETRKKLQALLPPPPASAGPPSP